MHVRVYVHVLYNGSAASAPRVPERGLLVQREVAQVDVGALARLLARSQIVLVQQVYQRAEPAVRREAATIHY